PSDFAIGKGSLYVGGVRVENSNDEATYKGQTSTEWVDYPDDRPGPEPTAEAAFRELVYLAVSEHEVGAVEDDALREVALGGPDTAARSRLIQRVQRVPAGEGDCAKALSDAMSKVWGPKGIVLDDATMELRSTARLKVKFVPAAGSSSPCQPTAQAGFLGA